MTQTQFQIKPEKQISQTESAQPYLSTHSFKEFIQNCEANYCRNFDQLIKKIVDQINSISAITIAGPSSSGKTTFSKHIAESLESAGVKVTMLSMDDYFVDRNMTPMLLNGKPDYEHIAAVDIELMHKNIKSLQNGETVEIPQFDFKNGVRAAIGKTISNAKDSILIIEGIHALNPQTSQILDSSKLLKIFINAEPTFGEPEIGDSRLLRRIVRDQIQRGHSGFNTLDMWESVRAGENQWILPFRNSAEIKFNTSFDYEINVFKKLITPFIEQIIDDKNCEHFETAARLNSWLKKFESEPTDEIPTDSLLREFIGTNH